MLPPGTIEAFGLYLVRTSALILAAPLLGTGSNFTGYRVGLIGVLSAVLYLAAGSPVVPDVQVVGFGILALREVLIGLTLAFLLHVVLLTVRVSPGLPVELDRSDPESSRRFFATFFTDLNLGTRRRSLKMLAIA